MKPNIFYILIFLLQGLPACSQQFPFVTDPGSLAGSSVAAGLYFANTNADRILMRNVHLFNTEYSQRVFYLQVASANIVGKINIEINTTKSRYVDLTHKNRSLSFFSYSKKKNNEKILGTIKKIIDNVQRELSKQRSTNILYGEKLNLYQNIMESLSKIHRLMDTVEDNIGQSKLLSRITQRK